MTRRRPTPSTTFYRHIGPIWLAPDPIALALSLITSYARWRRRRRHRHLYSTPKLHPHLPHSAHPPHHTHSKGNPPC